MKKYYAMKIINMLGIPQSEKETVKRELSLMQKFTHPNIVAYKVNVEFL